MAQVGCYERKLGKDLKHHKKLVVLSPKKTKPQECGRKQHHFPDCLKNHHIYVTILDRFRIRDRAKIDDYYHLSVVLLDNEHLKKES